MSFHSNGLENFQRFCLPFLVLLYLPMPGFSVPDIEGGLHRIQISLDGPKRHSEIRHDFLSGILPFDFYDLYQFLFAEFRLSVN